MRGPFRRPLWVVPGFHTNLVFAMIALKADGAVPHLMTAEPSGRAPTPEDPEETVIAPERASWGAVWRAVRAADPDLVVVRKTRGLSRRAYWCARAAGLPVIAYDQRPWLDPRPLTDRLGGLATGRPWRRLTPVHGLPGPGARPDPAAVYLPFPVASDEAAPAPRVGPPRLLLVGKLAERRKNHDVLLAALARLAPDHAFSLTIVGAGTLDIGNPDRAHRDAVIAAAESGPLAARIALRVDAPFEDMADIYRAHDVCILPSSREPLGSAPLEAMGRGCAALISDECGSAWYVAGAAEAGLEPGGVFRAGSVDALADALAPLLRDPAALLRRRRDAWDWARREFSPTLFARRFRELRA